MRMQKLNLKFISPVFYNKASSAQNQISAEQSSFYSNLLQSYSQQFAGQTSILNSLTNSFTPTLEAGPGQFGFTPQETSALRTGASDQISSAFQGAKIAQQNNAANAGGGNAFLPSGASAQLSSAISNSSASELSRTQNQITQAGYAQGNADYNTAAQMLSGTASLYNPTGYANAAGQAGTSAFNSATKIQEENNAWKGELAGFLGGAASSVLGAFTGNLFGGGGGSSGGNSIQDIETWNNGDQISNPIAPTIPAAMAPPS